MSDWAELYPDIPAVMDVTQVGEVLGLHPQVITRYLAAGQLPGSKDPTGKWRIPRDDLLDYFSSLPLTVR